jgi:hypothetical protein
VKETDAVDDQGSDVSERWPVLLIYRHGLCGLRSCPLAHSRAAM